MIWSVGLVVCNVTMGSGIYPSHILFLVAFPSPPGPDKQIPIVSVKPQILSILLKLELHYICCGEAKGMRSSK